MAQERPNAVTLKGNPLSLIGPELKPGDQAPNFTVLADLLTPVTLDSGQGKVRIISSVPSLDTPVCDAEIQRFNTEAAGLGENVEVWAISMDLPFAQKRWCSATNSDRVKVLSDYRTASFAEAYGVLIKDLRLASRAVFVVDQNDQIQYVEYVKEIAEQPDYEAALAAARQAAQGDSPAALS